MDFKPLPTSKQGNDQCFIIVDRLTKLVELIPCRQTSTAETIARLFYLHWYLKGHGAPTSIVSDRDKIFSSKLWNEFTQLSGTKLFMSTARHQQTDGGAESIVKELKIALGKYVNHCKDNWEEFLPLIQYAHNNTIHSTTRFKPFYLAYGLRPKNLFLSLDATITTLSTFPLLREIIWNRHTVIYYELKTQWLMNTIRCMTRHQLILLVTKYY